MDPQRGATNPAQIDRRHFLRSGVVVIAVELEDLSAPWRGYFEQRLAKRAR